MLLPRKSQGRAVQRLVTSWALDTTHEQGPPVIQLCPPSTDQPAFELSHFMEQDGEPWQLT